MPKYQPKDFDRIFEEVAGANDRAAISVGGSILEFALEQAIASRLREPQGETAKERKKEKGALFSPDKGIFGNFYAKIWGAYFLKVIGPSARNDIDLVRQIRNQASHDMNAISFKESPEIAALCLKLSFPKNSIPAAQTPPDLRGLFVLTVQFFTANLFLRAGDSHAEIKEASAALAPYLDQ